MHAKCCNEVVFFFFLLSIDYCCISFILKFDGSLATIQTKSVDEVGNIAWQCLNLAVWAQTDSKKKNWRNLNLAVASQVGLSRSALPSLA